MRRLHLFTYLLLSLPIGILAQQEGSEAGKNPFFVVQEKNGGSGQITIRQSNAIEQMMLFHIESNQRHPGVLGYRIQVYSGSGAKARQEAQNVRGRFLSVFPSEKITVEYTEPFWNVRVGYFRHKHESLPLLKRVKATFPNSYAVRDVNIKPELFDQE